MQKMDETIIDNPELEKLFQLDQGERKKLQEGLMDQSIVFKNDEERRERVQEMIMKNKLNTALDYYHAAMIFQHGKTIEDIQNAKNLAEISLQKGEIKAKWLTAATTDRFLIFSNKPQTWGTQSYYDQTEKKWKLWAYDPNTTDEQRLEMNVPKLDDILKSLMCISSDLM